jgi:flagellar basal-body rod protein FlgC
MNFLKSLSISSSALTAQRMRMDVIAQNIANANSTRTPEGGPYRRKVAILTAQNQNFSAYLSDSMNAAGGVRVSEIVEDTAPFKVMYDPSHPDADENGNVLLPNVDITQEMLDMMASTRAYESNITALNASKGMALKALEIGR